MGTTRRSILKFLGGAAVLPVLPDMSPTPPPEFVIGIDPAIPGSDFGAIAVAEVRSGVITSIKIISGGSAYTSSPCIRIENKSPSDLFVGFGS